MTTSDDGHAITLARFDMLQGQSFQRHVHDEHQLAWASSGALMVDVADECWVLPPTLALWLPSGMPHATAAVRPSVLRGVYLAPHRCRLPWTVPTVMSVSPLASALIEHLATNLEHAERGRAERVLIDVLRPADRAAIGLPLPTDPRARAVADALMRTPADPRSLDEFAADVSASSRTLLRLFLTQTGLTFSQWRTHARLQASIVLLAEGLSVSRVARDAGYATHSAFTAAFRRTTGHTPGDYLG